MSIPRGIKNHNPGNLRKTKIRWQGKVTPSTDPDFEQFVSAEMGIRAIARDLLTGYKRGNDTISEIISEWAPASENDTEAYIRVACLALNVAPDTVVDVDDYRVMAPLVKAIIKHENGQQPYSDDTIRSALLSAGVADVPQAEPTTSTEAKGAAAATIGGSGVTAIEGIYDAIDKLEPIKQTLIEISPVVSVAKYALLALTLVGAIAVMYGLILKFRKGLI